MVDWDAQNLSGLTEEEQHQLLSLLQKETCALRRSSDLWKVSKETLAAPPPIAPACLAAAPENIMPLV